MRRFHLGVAGGKDKVFLGGVPGWWSGGPDG